MDPITLVMLAVLALLIFFMFRNSRKRQKDQAELQTRMVPGAEVMLSFGVYGTLLSVDDEDNTARVEVSEGTVLRVHRQTLTRVVDPAGAAPDGSHDDLPHRDEPRGELGTDGDDAPPSTPNRDGN